LKTGKPIILFLIVTIMVMLGGCQTPGPQQFETALKKFRTHDRAEAISEIKSLAERGEPNSQAFLGSLYATGTGVPRDLHKALTWQEKAARKGQAMAQYNLAVMYSRGMGTEQNLEAAAKWFQAAAYQGVPEAYLHLGLFHERGWVLRKCPYAASNQYYLAGHAFLEKHDFIGARLALQNIKRLLPHSQLINQLATEIYMYE
jgi:TPR repeat protein